MIRGTKHKIIFTLALFVFLPSSAFAVSVANDSYKKLMTESGKLIGTLDPVKMAAGLRLIAGETTEVEADSQMARSARAGFVNALLSSDAAETFSKKGVDVNSVASAITAGKLDTEAAIGKALGLPAIKLNPEQSAQVELLVSDTQDDISGANFVTANQAEEKERKASDLGSEKNQMANVPKEPAGQMVTAPILDLSDPSWNRKIFASSNETPKLAQKEEPIAAGAYPAQNIRELTVLVLPRSRAKSSLFDQWIELKKQLSQIGIRMVRTNENIFEVAGHNFREFKDWRRTSRLAAITRVRK